MPLSLADQAFGNLNAAKPPEPAFVDAAVRRRIASHYRDKLRSAKRFYLDDDITETVVKLGYEHPDLLRAMLSRARTPFPTIWIEWPLETALALVGIEKEETAPERIGCLVEALHETEPLYRMTVITSVGRRASASYASVLFYLSRPIDQAEGEVADIIQRHSPISYGIKGALIPSTPLLLGSAFTDPAQKWRDVLADRPLEDGEAAYRAEQCMALASHAKIVFSPQMGQEVEKLRNSSSDTSVTNMLAQLIHVDLTEQAGTWRFVIAFLAVLNSKDRLHIENTGKSGEGRRFAAGQMVPFLEHLLVRLRLPRKDAMARLMREVRASIPRRRHDVMGHWKYRRKGNAGDPACDHVWVEINSTNETCAVCGWHRWWQKDTERGSAEVGYIMKDRLVTR